MPVKQRVAGSNPASTAKFLDPATQFEEIYIESYPKIRNYILKRCYDKELAEDITQEAFTKAYAHRLAFKPIGSPEAWIIKIAFNCYISYRRAKQNALRDNREPRLENKAEVRDELKEAQGEMDWEYLMKLLPPRKERIIRMRFELDMTNRQIGKTLGLAYGTVSREIYEAKNILRPNL